MTEASETGPFILRGNCYGRPRQESFDTLAEALHEYARLCDYPSEETGVMTWMPREISCSNGSILTWDDLDRLRPDPD